MRDAGAGRNVNELFLFAVRTQDRYRRMTRLGLMCHTAGFYYTRHSTADMVSMGVSELDEMPIKKWGVAKVKESEPEQFFIFLIDAEGSSLRISDFLSEQELREDLACKGISGTQIDPTIERARYDPVGVSTAKDSL